MCHVILRAETIIGFCSLRLPELQLRWELEVWEILTIWDRATWFSDSEPNYHVEWRVADEIMTRRKPDSRRSCQPSTHSAHYTILVLLIVYFSYEYNLSQWSNDHIPSYVHLLCCVVSFLDVNDVIYCSVSFLQIRNYLIATRILT